MDPGANMEDRSDADILPQHQNDICQHENDECTANDAESINPVCTPTATNDSISNVIPTCPGNTKEQLHNIDEEGKLELSTTIAMSETKGEESIEITTVRSSENDHAEETMSTVEGHTADSKCIDENILKPKSMNSNSSVSGEKEIISNRTSENNPPVDRVAENTVNSAESADDSVQESSSIKITSLEQEGEDHHTDKINERNLSKPLDGVNESTSAAINTENTETNISDVPEITQAHAGTVSGSLEILETNVDTNIISKATKAIQEKFDSNSAINELTTTNDKLDTASDNTEGEKTVNSESNVKISVISVHKNVLIDPSKEVINTDKENASETAAAEDLPLENTEIPLSLDPVESKSKLPLKNTDNDRSEEITDEECSNAFSNLKTNEVSEIPSSAVDASDKDTSLGKSNTEPENTEFVQFSQDKHEDAQIEVQSIDAEDPFGGDNLPSESNEPMEIDEDVGFSRLSRQTNNLQDSINVGLSDLSERHSVNDNAQQISVINDAPPQSYQTEEDVSTGSHVTVENTKAVQKTTKPLSEQTDSTDQMKNDDGQKDTADAMDAEQSQSDILPGQDDELCIIPDSMKVIVVEKKKDGIEMEKAQPVANTADSKDTSEEECKNSRSESVLKDTVTDKITDTGNKTVAESQKDTQQKESVLGISNKKPTDVINIDEESKCSEIEEIAAKEICKQCNEEKSCKIKVKIGSETYNVCSKPCKLLFNIANNKATDIPSDGVNSKHEKRCASCLLLIETNEEKNLSWETMEFCNEACLGKFQTKYGSYCRNCNGSVQPVSLGKYCVRFGYDVRQFCCSSCLEEFKKGLKVCSYCQKDISSGTEGFLAPVGDKGQFKDFCKQDCMEKYSKMNSTEIVTTEKKCCSVCQKEKLVYCEVQLHGTSPVAICSEPCLAAFKFVNKVEPEQCSTCKKFFELLNKRAFVVFYENEARTFCSKTCLNVFIITNRKIVPCNWCKVKKYNFDMIKKELKSGQIMMMCSLNCLTLYQVSINAVSAKRINCDFCKEYSQAQYHLTMSDATIRNFCSYNCVMNFQAQYTKSPITIPSGDDPVPTGMPKRTLPPRNVAPVPSKTNEIQNKKNMPVISSVTSLAEIGNGQVSPKSQQNNINNIVVSSNTVMQTQSPQVIYKQQVITRPASPVKLHNKMTQCKPLVHTKGVSVRPHPCTKSTQTDQVQQVLVPIPVPIYVPVPMRMYSMPFPVPVPFPLPIPVPIFIPTTKNSAKAIFKDIKRIQEKIPADPFEAELLMMAEMVATEKKANDSDSDSADDRDDTEACNDNSRDFSPGVDSGNTFGEDMLQMALKMATGELDEPAVDLEAALTPNTITATQTSSQTEPAVQNDVPSDRLVAASRGRKRLAPYKTRAAASNKRGRRASGAHEIPLMQPPEPQPLPQPRIMEPIEKPDANMALKYTFGVNAWRQWVIAKNAELEKQSTTTRRIKLFKTDLLQLTADELNYSLCLFVKEVRKPNGTEYAPDTIYYLCLGIQQYLFENNRIDNIFTDSYYEKFTDCLNEVAKKFSVLYRDAQYIVTRVEEEHLWECKQLGAHSPHVLLSTLMFFNTKHFNLVTVEEHMQLSFSHIMKHWKRNPAAQPTAAAGKVPGSRNVLLRFYPPQSALEGNSRKKKVYEQQENEENPLRCPVKLYEFYLSKCPESVKTRNDVFYLLPERSCVPDSPVWYSTSPLAKEHLIKMLYRIKMVKEINVALLTS